MTSFSVSFALCVLVERCRMSSKHVRRPFVGSSFPSSELEGRCHSWRWCSPPFYLERTVWTKESSECRPPVKLCGTYIHKYIYRQTKSTNIWEQKVDTLPSRFFFFLQSPATSRRFTNTCNGFSETKCHKKRRAVIPHKKVVRVDVEERKKTKKTQHNSISITLRLTERDA